MAVPGHFEANGTITLAGVDQAGEAMAAKARAAALGGFRGVNACERAIIARLCSLPVSMVGLYGRMALENMHAPAPAGKFKGDPATRLGPSVFDATHLPPGFDLATGKFVEVANG